MTESQIRDLEEKARKATPGPWVNNTDGFVVGFMVGNSGIDGEDYHVSAQISSDRMCDSETDAKNDAAYIAAANPATVLKLIESRQELRDSLAAVMALIDSGYLVRNIENDAAPGWAMKQLEPMMHLKYAADALARSR